MITATLANNAVISNSISCLSEIQREGKNISIFRRDISLLQSEINQVVSKKLVLNSSGEVHEILEQVKAQIRFHELSCPMLIEDIELLLGKFEEITRYSEFRLLLSVVDSDMCRRFHSDVNDLRLLTTYAGPGTLWIPEGIDEADYETHYEEASTGDVLILKGALYSNAQPIVHRSPIISESKSVRVILRIDTSAFLSDF